MKNRFALWLISALCGIISLLLDFVVIPVVFADGIHDSVWMALMVLLPTAAAVFLLKHIRNAPPVYIWLGLPIQYLILCIFAEPLSKIIGAPLHGSLGGLEYFFAAAVWPFIITLVQFCTLLLIRKKH